MKSSFALIILLSFCIISCNEANKRRQSGDFTVGQFKVRVVNNKNAQPELHLFNNADTSKKLLQTVRDVPFISAAIGKDSIKMVGTPEGSFEVKDKLVSFFSGKLLII